MKTNVEIISDLEQFTTWVEGLKAHNHQLMFKPIAEGKWSIAEILSHIMFWDRYILKEMIPNMKQDADLSTIEFQELNDKAAEYALSGVSFEFLLEELIESRKKLVSYLRGKTDEEFTVSFKINGDAVDNYTGYPFTLYNYICDFIWHDNHHKKQMEEFLSKM
ncbi:DinB family protein [Fredinandcohnia quinoae]|uniref:DinB family protein n=1 Tax=Fredinandcohnia quinoae TaxID=2918902 RepID=A0AAW5EB14_9BACI|nr:DinB family protein [Fredinandcohnia sp. SECRCQ15]MCH1626860.1 DinB family protein [Fredinandcohnia sp. SECRCQ15]